MLGGLGVIGAHRTCSMVPDFRTLSVSGELSVESVQLVADPPPLKIKTRVLKKQKNEQLSAELVHAPG